MDRKTFERLAFQAMRELPAEFRTHLENVDLIVAEHPSKEQLEDSGAYDLLGLYVGVPLLQRGTGPSFTFAMPDQVWLFRQSLIAHCRENALDLRTEIKRTLLHEVGHHLGLTESELQDLEAQ
jgi:predicted Zn-dependent protease with MMP-like domain